MTFGNGNPLGVDDVGSDAWQSYTCTAGGVANGSAVTARYRRIGETYDVVIVINHNGANTGQTTVTLPDGVNMSVPAAWTPIGTVVYIDTSATKRYAGVVIAPTATFTAGYCTIQSAANGQIVASSTLPDGAAYASGDQTLIQIRCAKA